jgi:hypothetical protein
MPYIKPMTRLVLDSAIDRLVEDLLEVTGQDPAPAGFVNYAVTRIVARAMRPSVGWSYASLSRALAVLRDAEAEMRRRLLDPYEDNVAHQNGDIPEYE